MNNPLKSLAVSTALIAAFSFTAASSVLAADSVKGEKIFKRCVGCHAVGPDAKKKVGPQLNGLLGRAAGVVANYKYGTGIIEARGEVGEDSDNDGYLDTPEGFAGLVWNEDNLFEYLDDPQKYIADYTKNPKARVKMRAFLKKEDQRKDVIAYLKTIGLDGNPIAQ